MLEDSLCPKMMAEPGKDFVPRRLAFVVIKCRRIDLPHAGFGPLRTWRKGNVVHDHFIVLHHKVGGHLCFEKSVLC